VDVKAALSTITGKHTATLYADKAKKSKVNLKDLRKHQGKLFFI